jgi:hypothetical protein
MIWLAVSGAAWTEAAARMAAPKAIGLRMVVS